MRFSTRTFYGLKAVLVLGGRFGEGSVSVSHIAKKESISVAYLEQILNALKKKGLVKSVRGPQGGYILAKKPSEIDLQTLFYTLAGQSVWASDSKSKAAQPVDEVTLANDLFWKKLKNAFENGLSKISLKDLLDEARQIQKKRSKNALPNFNI